MAQSTVKRALHGALQPRASAVALNRVIGSDASQIYVRLQANGHVFLLNPNGILLGRTAQVDVGGHWLDSTLSSRTRIS